ncbi:uncharacterized protein LOC116601884 isoform X1 [Nematostella vectensis]|uniref:uncharacterized protein LOC116601884 isoform X1 n=2 Tax=Nematostella vectensis TaxID=45351 RepID=UPI0020773BBC|nr:uncharacterized protein LOC116601884 isoform X1 [Nematostella vectensis]XP_048588191.1 uncharacterized protein LOC116601884 isoform X1 [Nematostella vectensis]XP_048588192.1 uncharacterized protein LOC116601884 isoform X1 [Nematostella vectensis]XP_048588193.1 uncharacterized protein LOC116601884 isoform X1 [Nematostella vectensis]XP_048588194.1 uncharacterized protein LOC116601884 isoform X1 [Nematostella vectensis]XP_048588195.1 uncharacterized protein LOC116601884 isoform X1 [Nematostell
MASGANENKVVTFLREEIQADDSIIQKFLLEKVDDKTVTLLSHEDLKTLGIDYLGDRLLIINHFKNSVREEKLERVRSLLDASKKRKQKSTNNASTSKNAPTLTYYFGWKHWNESRKEYIQKKTNNGGGSRECKLPRNASKEECMSKAKEFFFPEGESPEGRQDLMTFKLTGIEKEIDDDFKYEDYKRDTGLSRPRLFLCSRRRISCGKANNLEDSDSDSDLLKSVFDSGYADSEAGPSFEFDKAALADILGTSREDNQSELIGTSEERKAIFKEQLEQLEESSRIDKEKDRLRLEEEQELTKQEEIRQKRRRRVLDEPAPGDQSVEVRIRHPRMGVLKRRFHVRSSVQAVYDWAGSVSATPLYFQLCKYPNTVIYPSDEISQACNEILNVVSRGQPVPLSVEEDSVTINDGQKLYIDIDMDDTIPDALHIGLSDTPPQMLLEDDEPMTEEEAIALTHYNVLNKKRQEELTKYLKTNIVEIDKDHIVEEILKLYKDTSLLQNYLEIECGLTATGDGVLREMLTSFWEKFLMRNGEGSREIPLPLGPSIARETYEILGRIYHHGFMLTGSFPVTIPRASIHYALFDCVKDECLEESFLNTLPAKQRETLSAALSSKSAASFPDKIVCDILEDYGNMRWPSQENICSIVKDVAVHELVAKPAMALQQFRSGMGEFWKDVPPQEIDAVYKLSQPTSRRVKAALRGNPLTKKEESVLRWLKLFIDECGDKMLRRFLVFCTASDSLAPDKTIQVRFESMPSAAIRPKAQTCFRILILPTNFCGYAAFQANMDIYLTYRDAWEMKDY